MSKQPTQIVYITVGFSTEDFAKIDEIVTELDVSKAKFIRKIVLEKINKRGE